MAEIDPEFAAAITSVMASVESFIANKRKKRRAVAAAWSALSLELEANEDDDEQGKEKRTRLEYEYPRSDYSVSPWSRMLRHPKLEDPNSRAAKRFRRRFRIPYVFFKDLLATVKVKRWFPTGEEADDCGRPCIPVELKVLCALQILGRGNLFDDVCQLSYMSEATIQAAFHKFCKHFAEEMYDAHIRLPTGNDLAKAMRHYHKMGFTGAIGSTDVTHIRWDCRRSSQAQSYTGKGGYPKIAYQATVDHTGRVLGVTAGFPRAQNDKTIIRYDALVGRIQQDPEFSEQEYQLRDEQGGFVSLKGVYLLVDNGYHKWRVTQEPTKYPGNSNEASYSKALKSTHKDDVKSFFGVVKGRFRILKLPAPYLDKKAMDNVFFTCCILHNMLHDYDGIDRLEEGVDWAGSDGLHDLWVHDPELDVNVVGRQNYDSVETDVAHDELQEQLIASYTWRRKHNDILWSRRSGDSS